MKLIGRSWDDLSVEERAQVRASFPKWKREDLVKMRWERRDGIWRCYDYQALARTFK